VNFSQITYNYLRACKINVSKDYFEKRIKSHPYYPALLSFTDTLDEFRQEYKAIQAEEEHIPQFSFPFLAQTPKAVNGFEIVHSPSYYEAEKKEFLNRWEGIAVMVNPSQQVKNVDHERFLINEKRTVSYLKIAIGTGLIIFRIKRLSRELVYK
jgi:hypothetical protein